MSMSFSEFKRLLGADPYNRDSGTLSARGSAPEFEQAAVIAEAFEHKLESALRIQPPADLLENIQAIPEQPAQRFNWMPLAMAASLLLAIGAVGVAWQQSQQLQQVEAYLAKHYADDGSVLLKRAEGGVSEQSITRIMASLNATVGQPLTDRIQYIKFCPTPAGRGAHMVVSTQQGPVTIIFMPETLVTDGKVVEFDQMHAYLLNLEHGSAAIIGTRTQPVETLKAVVKNALKTGLLDV